MPDSMENEIIGAVAYDLISKISPHELPLFKVTRAAYFDNSERVVQRTPTDDTLGFGLEGATTFMTPIILAVSTAAPYSSAHFLADSIVKGLITESAHLR